MVKLQKDYLRVSSEHVGSREADKQTNAIFMKLSPSILNAGVTRVVLRM